MQPDILSFFPAGLTPRPAQAELLRAVQAGWVTYDVIAALCPPASGKTEIAVTIAAWRAACGDTTNYLPPDNVLVQQTAKRYPQLTTLLRRSLYAKDDDNPVYAKALLSARYAKAKNEAWDATTRLMNTHVMRAHRMYAPVQIFDEAHKLKDMLSEWTPLRIWKSEHNYPSTLATVADVIEWLQCHGMLGLALEIGRVRDSSVVEYTTRKRKLKVEPCLEVRRSVPRHAAKVLWPWEVKKLVLMSATIGPKDIAELGLDKRNVLYLNCDSPIPAAQRPVVYQPTCNLGRKFLAHSLPVFAKKLAALLEVEPGKGLVHLPYGMARDLRELLSHPRILWHDKHDKQNVLSRYAAMPADSGAVLVASGLYEGVDLPWADDCWQVIGKVPYLSLGDEDVKARLKADPDWYDWQAIKLLLQAYGRLPRRPDGYGKTYIFDMAYGRLLSADRARTTRMFPPHYLAATGGKCA